MKKLKETLRKRRVVLTVPFLVAVIAAVVLLVSAALAAVVLFLIPSTINIVAAPLEAEAFADPLATIPMPAISWGDQEHGAHIQIDIYVKNTGVEPLTGVYLVIQEDVSAFMTYSFTPATVDLLAGSIGHFLFEADIPVAAPLGPQSFTYAGMAP